jgi:hypothetical protein
MGGNVFYTAVAFRRKGQTTRAAVLLWCGADLAPRGRERRASPPLRLPAWSALQGSVPPGRARPSQSSGPHARRRSASCTTPICRWVWGLGRILLSSRSPSTTLSASRGHDDLNLLRILSPFANEHVRRVLIRDFSDRNAISSRLMRYRDQNGQDWADIIDFLTLWPEARKRVVQLLAEIEA